MENTKIVPEITNLHLQLLLEEALVKFYSKDAKELLLKEGVERSCVFRIGIYMQDLMKTSLYKELNLDCEYNKLGNIPKAIFGYIDKNRVQPDLIIHKRNTKTNIMIAEFKGYWNENTDNDIKKLEYFTCQDSKNEYKYQLGALVVLKENQPFITYFENGKKSRSLTVTGLG